MGIWVRSQNGFVLMEIDTISAKLIENEYCCYTKNYGQILGKYSTEEKTLKVMDMIQNQLITVVENNTKYLPCLKSSSWENLYQNSKIVFQMPQDSELEK